MGKEPLPNENTPEDDVISSDDLGGSEGESDLASDELGNTEDERYEQKEELRGHGRKIK